MQISEDMYEDDEVYENYEEEENPQYEDGFEYGEEEWRTGSGYDDDDYENPDYEYEEE